MQTAGEADLDFGEFMLFCSVRQAADQPAPYIADENESDALEDVPDVPNVQSDHWKLIKKIGEESVT
jgi:hypothetical protein